jgi:hypothetical protein
VESPNSWSVKTLMTKAELLKLLEPFPDDALIVAGTGYDWMDGWEDVESIRLIEIALTPDDIGGVKYIEPDEYGAGELPADLERLPAIPFARSPYASDHET